MKSRTPWILLAAHLAAFTLMMAGQVAEGTVANFLVAIGLVVEFPGWRVAWAICRTTGSQLVFAFCFNAAMYYTAGLVIDRASAPRPPRP